ncbi:hypothetical protein BDZ89DRAFT_1137728 [Hymenopellis radicata]|nr:hypothetical protein BDZ89DRAFT_1137728 [Hymenopellis radicata]
MNHASLWLKLADAGLPGIYWVRTVLYAKMIYVVKVRGGISEDYKSLYGVLMGDPVSPTLWNIFLCTFQLPDRPDDACLRGVHVSHLEHADNLVIISESRAGLQAHLDVLDVLACWCCANFLQGENVATES